MKTHRRLVLLVSLFLAASPLSRAVQAATYSVGAYVSPIETRMNLLCLAASLVIAIALVWRLSSTGVVVAAEARVRRRN